MARWDDEELDWKINTYDDAPCHTCVYRERKYEVGGASNSCEKYPVPRYSIGVKGKPHGILEGTEKCKYYEKEKP